jgi:hypothetical protein
MADMLNSKVATTLLSLFNVGCAILKLLSKIRFCFIQLHAFSLRRTHKTRPYSCNTISVSLYSVKETFHK